MLLVKVFQEIYIINKKYIQDEQIRNPGRWIYFNYTVYRWRQALPPINREAHRMTMVSKRMEARMNLES